MREAAEPACPAVRSIAQMVCRVDIASNRPSSPAVRVAGFGKARVNRRWNGPASSGKSLRNASKKAY